MDEKDFLTHWNQKRSQLIQSQIGPTLYFGILISAAMSHNLKDLDTRTKVFIALITGVIGLLTVLGQVAIIREGHATVVSLLKLEKKSLLANSIADSERLVIWSGVMVNILGAVAYGTLLWILFK
jgi:hypothetical protein